MSKEIEEQLDYEDSLLQFYTVCQQYGCRTVLKDFRVAFPDMYEEIITQANRLKPEKHIAALLR